MKRTLFVAALLALVLPACADTPTAPDRSIKPSLDLTNTTTGDPLFAPDAVFPSSNAVNVTNGWANVAFVSSDFGSVTLRFSQPRGFYACFEYRVDGAAAPAGSQNYNNLVTDGLYAFECENNSSELVTIAAGQYVDVRMAFGAESDERFNWTRFYAPTGSCVFNKTNSTWTLAGDCTTVQTIFLPAGVTLDGAGHTITAKDPSGGHFLGAIVQNEGSSANVINLTLTTDNLTNACDGGDARLRGIFFKGAAGTIANNTVQNLNQGNSGCQEGNAIEASYFPVDAATSYLGVTIDGNVVTSYQKNGITANGNVAASITNNTVTGAGPVDWIAQNGVQVGFGATALVRKNTISGNSYTPDSYVGCGLLMYQATGVKQQSNTLSANEKDVCNYGRGGGNTQVVTP